VDSLKEVAPFVWTAKPSSISGFQPIVKQPRLATAEKNIHYLASVVAKRSGAVFDCINRSSGLFLPVSPKLFHTHEGKLLRT
jgi:hypothetical protein